MVGKRAQVIVPGSVITDSGMTQAALALYVLMQWHTGEDSSFHATREGLADQLHVNEKTVRRAWALLEQHGHLVLTRRALGKGQGRIEKAEFPVLSKGDMGGDAKGGSHVPLNTARGDMVEELKGDTDAASERGIKGDTPFTPKGDIAENAKGGSHVPLGGAPPYNPPSLYLSEKTCTVQAETAKGDMSDLETTSQQSASSLSSAPSGNVRPKRPAQAYQPSEQAERSLAAWERHAPLPGTGNRTACLKTLDDLARLDHLSWDRINRLCAWAVKEWVPKGYLASPVSLREWTRKKDMRTWEALERQALGQEAQKAREEPQKPSYSERDLAYQQWYLTQFRLVAPTPYAPQEWKESP